MYSMNITHLFYDLNFEIFTLSTVWGEEGLNVSSPIWFNFNNH